MTPAAVLAVLLALQPAAERGWARATAHAVAQAARRHQVSARVMLALAMQESSLRPVHGLREGAPWDLGVWQLNVHTARAYGCDLTVLVAHDPEHSADCAARVLAAKLRLCAGRLDVPAWACYHSMDPARAAAYAAAVRRWL